MSREVRVWGADSGDFAGGRLIWSALNALRPAMDQPPSVVDLGELQLLRPYTLASLAALGALGEGRSRLVLPQTHDSREYILRSGLTQFYQCPEATHSDESSRIIRVRRLTSPSPSFADEISEAWEREFGGMPAGLKARLADHLDEVVRNALSHAASPIGCIVAATVYAGSRVVEVAVLDLGQTIRGHLSKNPLHSSIMSDEEAIILATREGVTGTPPGQVNSLGEPNSGVGLFELRAYCESGGGDLSIVSGGSCATFSADSGLRAWRFAGGFPGTLVNVRFLVW